MLQGLSSQVLRFWFFRCLFFFNELESYEILRKVSPAKYRFN